MNTLDLYEGLVISGGSGFIISHGFGSLLTLGLDTFDDVVFVNSFDVTATVGMAFEVFKSGSLPTVFTSSKKLPELMNKFNELMDKFPVVLGVTEQCPVMGTPHCKLDSLCINAAKAAATAISSGGPVVLFI